MGTAAQSCIQRRQTSFLCLGVLSGAPTLMALGTSLKAGGTRVLLRERRRASLEEAHEAYLELPQPGGEKIARIA